MQLYRIFDSAAAKPLYRYEGNAKDAQDRTKLIASRADARIELVKVDIAKASLLLYLNNETECCEFPVLRTWKLSPRGGLQEIPNGE